ncbi:MAG: type IV pilin protein [Sandaracinaceae bacterium]
MNPPAPPTPESKGKKSNRVLVLVLVVVGLGVLAVPCLGVTAAIAIPAFVHYLARSRIAEAETNLRAMHTAAAAYYAQESFVGGEVQTGCVVGSAISEEPSLEPRVRSWPAEFEALGFAPPDPVRYQYEIVSVGGCGHGPNELLYSFRAHGDLDGDTLTSLFEISSGSDESNSLTRSAEIYRENELE